MIAPDLQVFQKIPKKDETNHKAYTMIIKALGGPICHLVKVAPRPSPLEVQEPSNQLEQFEQTSFAGALDRGFLSSSQDLPTNRDGDGNI